MFCPDLTPGKGTRIVSLLKHFTEIIDPGHRCRRPGIFSKMSTARPFRKTSIKDVARRAGVSTTTVSYFVSGRENVCGPETAQRIRDAVEELHYTPSSLTRGLRREATRTIGVCMYSPFDPEVRFGSVFLERLWRGIVRESDAADYSLLHYPYSVRESESSQAFLDGRVDGLLLQYGERASVVAQAGMPTVLLARALDLPDGCGAVYADETGTARVALDHLHGLGHRRIAHLAGPVEAYRGNSGLLNPADDVAKLRLEAYTSWMQAAGLYDPALIGYAGSWFERDRVAEVLGAWRALPEPPTAVLCANDTLGVAVTEAALQMGWRVPDSLSVVGVDDSAEAREAPVPLTSVAVPVDAIGSEAVSALVRMMNGAPVDACRVAVPVTDIVVRGSTAAVPAAP
jgi:Transcriptional regulators